MNTIFWIFVIISSVSIAYLVYVSLCHREAIQRNNKQISHVERRTDKLEVSLDQLYKQWESYKSTHKNE